MGEVVAALAAAPEAGERGLMGRCAFHLEAVKRHRDRISLDELQCQ